MGDQGHSLCVLENRLLTTPGKLTQTSGLPPGKVQSVPGWPQTRAQMLEPLSFPGRCIETNGLGKRNEKSYKMGIINRSDNLHSLESFLPLCSCHVR